MIRLLGRQTSGNVQKVIFCLEEMGEPYTREDYGRQFSNTQTHDYRKLNPNAGYRLDRRRHGDLGVEHDPALPGRQSIARTHLRDAGRATRWNGRMDWLLAHLEHALRGGVPGRQEKPEERGADFAMQSADLIAQLKILDGHTPDALLRPRSAHHRRHGAGADRQALSRVPDRAPSHA